MPHSRFIRNGDFHKRGYQPTAIGSDSLFMRKWQLRCGHDVIINMHALINMHVIRNMMSHFSGKLGNTSRMTSHTNAWKIKRTWTHISTQHCIHRNVTYHKTTKHHSYGVLDLPWKPLTLGNSWTSKQVVYTHVYIYMWILEIRELNLKTTKSNLNMLVGFAFVLWDTQGKWGMPRWWENTLPSPRTPLQFMFVWKKNDLLCKNPGFQDSPIAMSRTCKIALKAPLET